MRVRETQLCRQRGAALATVLVALTLLLPLGALAVLQARSGLLTQQSLRGDAESLHAAEAGIACALARLQSGTDFAELLRGPDHLSGTADDGLPPAPLDCGAALPPPQCFEVRFENGGGLDKLVIVASGHGSRGATRVLEQHVRRGSGPALERRGWRER